jgi:hypothetical protein
VNPLGGAFGQFSPLVDSQQTNGLLNSTPMAKFAMDTSVMLHDWDKRTTFIFL